MNQAEPLCREALNILRQGLPEQHPDVATGLNYLGNLLYMQEKYQGAATAFDEALKIRRQSLRAGHPFIALTLSGLGFVQRKLKHFDEAAAMLREAITIEDENRSLSHPARAHRRNNLAVVFLLAMNLPQAASVNREAWDLKLTVTDGGHDITSARILFVRIVLHLLDGSSVRVCLGQLRLLLLGPELEHLGGIAPIWDVADLIAHLGTVLSDEDAEVMKSVVLALNDRSRTGELNRFLMWRNQPTVALDIPWLKLTNA